MKRILGVALLCAGLLATAGCLVPGEFTARLDVKADGSYVFTYDGTMLHLAMRDEREKGDLTPEREEKETASTLEKLGGDPFVVQAAYAGNDLFALSYKCEGNVFAEPMHMLSRDAGLFELTADDDRTTASFLFLPGGEDAEEEDLDPEDDLVRMLSGMRGTIVVHCELPVVKTLGDPIVDPAANLHTWTVSGLHRRMPGIVFKLREE